ncbi:hypothetical protein [Cryptosporangium aurantiacum]|uniref:Cysteine dioxygenase type I n=1 Tax=Cryptosporangium aurantiacum TaxID=134849 RepID=A0A1M7RDP5_9ACTN|nr:hypothetical protein [Cryptosporangium aurantiacum]SHN44427.1 hypothetical protein SAMN05443668_110206 [Cryptosporangium aurantiacum]
MTHSAPEGVLQRLLGGAEHLDAPMADLQQWHSALLGRMSDPRSVINEVYALLQEENRSDAIRAAARETPTHYVWPLLGAHREDFGVYLHEYKQEPRSASYATTIHNHRYDFVSGILRGGYTQDTFSVTLNDSEAIATDINCISSEEFRRGTVNSVNRHSWHRLRRVSSGTLTLVIKGPAIAPYSISAEEGHNRVTYHTPVERRLPMVIHSLEAALAELS